MQAIYNAPEPMPEVAAVNPTLYLHFNGANYFLRTK